MTLVDKKRECLMAKPFVKWVGGKRQLMPEIVVRMPQDLVGGSGFAGNYFEPFVGGGAVFFELESRGVRRAELNDFNPELANLYRVVRDNPKGLLREMAALGSGTVRAEYDAIRAWDRDAEAFASRSEEQRAARFAFLNRTAFNGLWRVNASGFHNVPFGDYKAPGFPDEALLTECSRALSSAEVSTGDFAEAVKSAGEGDFVYFDPPYFPLNATSSFASYTSAGFGAAEQLRLAEVCEELTAKGVRWMLSNSSAKAAVDLFGDARGVGSFSALVMAGRALNSKGSERSKKVPELLAWNYDESGRVVSRPARTPALREAFERERAAEAAGRSTKKEVRRKKS